MDGGFPVYMLDDDTILYLCEDLTHIEFWDRVVSSVVSEKTGIVRRKLSNLPYCQRRARVVDKKFYCGEVISDELFKRIEEELQMRLKYIYDEHETRCPISVYEFKGLRY